MSQSKRAALSGAAVAVMLVAAMGPAAAADGTDAPTEAATSGRVGTDGSAVQAQSRSFDGGVITVSSEGSTTNGSNATGASNGAAGGDASGTDYGNIREGSDTAWAVIGYKGGNGQSGGNGAQGGTGGNVGGITVTALQTDNFTKEEISISITQTDGGTGGDGSAGGNGGNGGSATSANNAGINKSQEIPGHGSQPLYHAVGGNGGHGADGGDGGTGGTGGSAGDITVGLIESTENAADFVAQLGSANINITGGNGGNGGAGGNGGNGGAGGKAGDAVAGYYQLGGLFGAAPGEAYSGNGGNGGNGGAAGSGGSGGDGANVSVTMIDGSKSAANSTISARSLVVNIRGGDGGDAGQAGQAGQGGTGTAAGIQGASSNGSNISAAYGSAGSAGTNGSNGRSAADGAAGKGGNAVLEVVKLVSHGTSTIDVDAVNLSATAGASGDGASGTDGSVGNASIRFSTLTDIDDSRVSLGSVSVTATGGANQSGASAGQAQVSLFDLNAVTNFTASLSGEVSLKGVSTAGTSDVSFATLTEVGSATFTFDSVTLEADSAQGTTKISGIRTAGTTTSLVLKAQTGSSIAMNASYTGAGTADVKLLNLDGGTVTLGSDLTMTVTNDTEGAAEIAAASFKNLTLNFDDGNGGYLKLTSANRPIEFAGEVTLELSLDAVTGKADNLTATAFTAQDDNTTVYLNLDNSVLLEQIQSGQCTGTDCSQSFSDLYLLTGDTTDFSLEEAASGAKILISEQARGLDVQFGQEYKRYAMEYDLNQVDEGIRLDGVSVDESYHGTDGEHGADQADVLNTVATTWSNDNAVGTAENGADGSDAHLYGNGGDGGDGGDGASYHIVGMASAGGTVNINEAIILTAVGGNGGDGGDGGNADGYDFRVNGRGANLGVTVGAGGNGGAGGDVSLTGFVSTDATLQLTLGADIVLSATGGRGGAGGLAGDTAKGENDGEFHTLYDDAGDAVDYVTDSADGQQGRDGNASAVGVSVVGDGRLSGEGYAWTLRTLTVTGDSKIDVSARAYGDATATARSLSAENARLIIDGNLTLKSTVYRDDDQTGSTGDGAYLKNSWLTFARSETGYRTVETDRLTFAGDYNLISLNTGVANGDADTLIVTDGFALDPDSSNVVHVTVQDDTLTSYLKGEIDLADSVDWSSLDIDLISVTQGSGVGICTENGQTNCVRFEYAASSSSSADTGAIWSEAKRRSAMLELSNDAESVFVSGVSIDESKHGNDGVDSTVVHNVRETVTAAFDGTAATFTATYDGTYKGSETLNGTDGTDAHLFGLGGDGGDGADGQGYGVRGMQLSGQTLAIDGAALTVTGGNAGNGGNGGAGAGAGHSINDGSGTGGTIITADGSTKNVVCEAGQNCVTSGNAGQGGDGGDAMAMAFAVDGWQPTTELTIGTEGLTVITTAGNGGNSGKAGEAVLDDVGFCDGRTVGVDCFLSTVAGQSRYGGNGGDAQSAGIDKRGDSDLSVTLDGALTVSATAGKGGTSANTTTDLNLDGSDGDAFAIGILSTGGTLSLGSSDSSTVRITATAASSGNSTAGEANRSRLAAYSLYASDTVVEVRNSMQLATAKKYADEATAQTGDGVYLRNGALDFSALDFHGDGLTTFQRFAAGAGAAAAAQTVAFRTFTTDKLTLSGDVSMTFYTDLSTGEGDRIVVEGLNGQKGLVDFSNLTRLTVRIGDDAYLASIYNENKDRLQYGTVISTDADTTLQDVVLIDLSQADAVAGTDKSLTGRLGQIETEVVDDVGALRYSYNSIIEQSADGSILLKGFAFTSMGTEGSEIVRSVSDSLFVTNFVHENLLSERFRLLRDEQGVTRSGLWASADYGELDLTNGAFGGRSVSASRYVLHVGADAVGRLQDAYRLVGLYAFTGSVENDLQSGVDEQREYGLGLYGAVAFDSGLYLESRVHWSRFEHALSAVAPDGTLDGADYSFDALNLAATVGYKWDFSPNWVLDTSVTADYWSIENKRFATKSGLQMEQNAYLNVGVLGEIMLGRYWHEKRTLVYGQVRGGQYLSNNEALMVDDPVHQSTFEFDVGDYSHWFADVSLGARIRPSETTDVYLLVKRTFAEKIGANYGLKAEWRWHF